MTDIQTSRQTSWNDFKAHSLRDVTQQTDGRTDDMRLQDGTLHYSASHGNNSGDKCMVFSHAWNFPCFEELLIECLAV